jgi:hypothetical protein
MDQFVVIYDKDIVNGRINRSIINRINRERIPVIICRDIQNLKELPNWPSVEEVFCDGCPNLTELPNWPNVYVVDCSYCPKLTQLPEWTTIKTIECTNCPGLTELPNWPNVEVVKCENSPIIKIGYMPEIEFISSDNISLEDVIKNNKIISVATNGGIWQKVYNIPNDYCFCGDKLNNGTNVLIHKCGKMIHEDCLMEWYNTEVADIEYRSEHLPHPTIISTRLKNNLKCPYCRQYFGRRKKNRKNKNKKSKKKSKKKKNKISLFT